MNERLRHVIVVDDHDLVRMGICGLIDDIDGVVVAGECASGEEALGMVRELRPDIVFMDIRMPGMGGLEATDRLLASHPDLKVIVISAFNDEIYPTQLLKAGAVGYITKNAEHDEIRQAVRKVLAGEVYVSAAIAQQLVINGLSSGQESSPFARLSKRELQITQMICSGHRPNKIAAVLNVSPKTINAHKYRVFEKLNVHNDVELTLLAVKYQLVDPDEIL